MTTIREIVERIRLVLKDEDDGDESTVLRWSDAELLFWVTDAQREIVRVIPDANPVDEVVELAAGSKQVLDRSRVWGLLDVVRDLGTGRPIRRISKEAFDLSFINAYSREPARPRNYYYSITNRFVFYVDPPAPDTSSQSADNISVEITVSKIPDTVLSMGSEVDPTNLEISSVFTNAVVEFVLYKAYMKDAPYASNATLASTHHTAFLSALGVKNDTIG